MVLSFCPSQKTGLPVAYYTLVLWLDPEILLLFFTLGVPLGQVIRIANHRWHSSLAREGEGWFSTCADFVFQSPLPVSFSFQPSTSGSARHYDCLTMVLCLAPFSPSPLQYIFVDVFIQYLWITTDFCNSIQGFSIPFRAADLLLHSRNPNLVLGFDSSHPNKQVRSCSQTGVPSHTASAV